MIKIDGDTFSLESEEHIILLGAKQGAVFESGTHKTHFISELRDQVTNHLLESNKNLIIVDQVSTAGDLRELTEDDCVILDEANLDVRILETFVERVRRSHAYLISVGRLMVRQLDCSVDAVYCINYDGEFKIEQVFEPCGVNPVKNDGVYCEDCGAVAGVYEECLNTSVVSVGGRFGFIRNVKGSAPFIIADKPKFGQVLLKMLYFYKTSRKVNALSLFLPACFEEIVCEVLRCEESPKRRQMSFDDEDYHEKLASATGRWSKQHTAKSLEKLGEVWSDSDILQCLRDFYYGEYGDERYCYYIDVNDFWSGNASRVF